MRLEKFINEKFFDAFKYNGKTIEIFVNPSKRELREMYASISDQTYGSVGFICDLIDDKIYFFSRQYIIHQDAFNQIKPSGPKLYQDSRYLTGELNVEKGKVRNMNFDSFQRFSTSQVIKEVLDSDWSYFDKWIPNIDKELHDYFKQWKRTNKGFLEAS